MWESDKPVASGEKWVAPFMARFSAYLQSEKVVHRTDDDVDGRGAANLSPQVVLKIYSETQLMACCLHLVVHISNGDSPLLWPSQSSCKNLKRSQVNSSSAITFSPTKRKRLSGKMTPWYLVEVKGRRYIWVILSPHYPQYEKSE